MRNIISTLFIGFVLIACQSNKPFDVKVTDSINSYLKTYSAGDKFLAVESFKIIKEYTVKERKEKVNENTLATVRKMNETFPSEDILAYYEKEFDFLKSQEDENAIAVYEVKFLIKKETMVNDEAPLEFKALLLNDNNMTVVFLSQFKEVSSH